MIKYLNYNSTDYMHTGVFNPSDRAYPEVDQMRTEWESYEQRVKDYIKAPNTSKVVITSGASEGVATCMWWIKSVFGEGGVVWGSVYDHAVIRLNTKVYGLKYNTDSEPPADTVAIFITHVDPKNGEIFEVDELVKKIKAMRANTFSNRKLSYNPLIFLDVSQSITKIPIKMEEWGINGVMFSLHKIGGEIGTGLLVVDDRKDAFYKPLVFGFQQDGFRGGTYPLEKVLRCNFFELTDDIDSRKEIWQKGYDYFKSKGMNIYTPKGKHLYNTYLINIQKACPLKIINALAVEYGIYIGTASACKGETINSKTSKNKDEFIRISFKYPNEIDIDTLSKIVEITKIIISEPDDE